MKEYLTPRSNTLQLPIALEHFYAGHWAEDTAVQPTGGR